jgi:hypothetical protein
MAAEHYSRQFPGTQPCSLVDAAASCTDPITVPCRRRVAVVSRLFELNATCECSTGGQVADESA